MAIRRRLHLAEYNVRYNFGYGLGNGMRNLYNGKTGLRIKDDLLLVGLCFAPLDALFNRVGPGDNIIIEAVRRDLT
jgi:hypothetical protein